MVTVYVSDVDGAERKQASAMPGDLKGEKKEADGKITKGRVAIHRALELTILGQDGKSLSVGKEDKVTAEFPDTALTFGRPSISAANAEIPVRSRTKSSRVRGNIG